MPEVDIPGVLAELKQAFEAGCCATRASRPSGSANTKYAPVGSDRIGRQSQTSVRTGEGWKIFSAHVSFLA